MKSDLFQNNPVSIYLFKASNGNTRTMCRSNVFIVNFEQIYRIVLVFQFLTLNKKIPAEDVLFLCSHSRLFLSSVIDYKSSFQEKKIICVTHFWPAFSFYHSFLSSIPLFLFLSLRDFLMFSGGIEKERKIKNGWNKFRAKICYFSVPQPTLGNYLGNSVT